MITCKQFPGKEFETKEDMFKSLRENASRIISVKKAEVYKSHEKGGAYSTFLLKTNDEAEKAGFHMKDGFVYPIINTTRYLDSHDDVHFDNVWNKSVKEQSGKLFYVVDHEVKVDNIIAWPEDITVMVKSIPWNFVNKSYEGSTEALIFAIDKSKIVHDKAKQIIEQKRNIQNSVRMQYIVIKLGMNSNAPEDTDAKKYFDERINFIANKDLAEKNGYFFGVEEAKILTEGSMVIKGSNDATAIVEKMKEAGSATSSTIEPVQATQKAVSNFFNPNLI